MYRIYVYKCWKVGIGRFAFWDVIKCISDITNLCHWSHLVQGGLAGYSWWATVYWHPLTFIELVDMYAMLYYDHIVLYCTFIVYVHDHGTFSPTLVLFLLLWSFSWPSSATGSVCVADLAQKVVTRCTIIPEMILRQWIRDKVMDHRKFQRVQGDILSDNEISEEN